MKNLLVAFFVCSCFINNTFAISEVDYQSHYNQKIVPLIKSMSEGFFKGENNLSIHYRTYLRPEAHDCLLILPGRTEPVEKYAEVVYDLLQSPIGKNLNFYLMDHRGQGSSGRMTKIYDLGSIDKYSNYVADIETFLRIQKLNQNCDRKFLLAHSMGGGIGISFILKNPTFFDRVALSSPMLKIITKPYPYKMAQAIVETSILLGRGAKFALGQKGYNPNLSFAENTFTTSPERFKMTMSIFENDPKTKLGGVSNNWLHEIIKGTKLIRARYHEITIPLKIFSAGIETYTEPGEAVKLCREAADCEYFLFPTSKHEVLMDRDETRSSVLRSLISFFN